MCGAVYASVTFSGRTEILPMVGLALFAAGFSLGAFSLSLWLILRRVLSGNRMQRSGQARPAAD